MFDFDEDEVRVLKLSHYNQTRYGDTQLRAAVGVNGGYGENTINDGYHDAVEILYQSVANSTQLCSDAMLVKIREHLSDTFLKDVDSNIARMRTQHKADKDDSELKKLVEEIIKEQYTIVLRQIVGDVIDELDFVNLTDPMVYPIIFCARHSIELCLKWLLRQISSIKIIKENKKLFINYKTATNEADIISYSTQLENKYECLGIEIKTKTHDIEKLCELICEYYDVDVNIKKFFDIILPYLSDYFIDPAGDVFRYWNDSSGEPNLESRDIRLISLDIFKDKYDIIYKKIIELFYLVIEVKIAIERTDTFTKTLSRWQLEEIARKLPQRSTWGKELPAIKKQIIDDYGLSSREFSEALNIIQENREFCVNIGMEIPFKNFSDTSIKNYVQYVNGNLDEEEICNLLSFDDYILLMTFLDMSGRVTDNNGFLYFPEQLDNIYADYKSRLSRPESYDFVQLKNNYDRIVKGMKRSGQKTYVEKLQKATELY